MCSGGLRNLLKLPMKSTLHVYFLERRSMAFQFFKDPSKDFFKIFIYLFICLHRVVVAACELLAAVCGI